MHKHYTVRFARGALPLQTPAERYFLDPELGHQKGRGSVWGVLAGSVVWEWGAAECWMVEQENLRPQGGGVTGPPHRGFYIKGSWGSGTGPGEPKMGMSAGEGPIRPIPPPSMGRTPPHPKSPGL